METMYVVSASGVVVITAAYFFLARARTTGNVPKKMKRIVLSEASTDMDKVTLSVEEVDVPKPKSGQVLIRVSAAPVNPSDYGVWKTAGQNPTNSFPMPIGNEGSGVVVASGGGIYAGSIVGSTVGVLGGMEKKQGTYQEYITVSALTSAFPIQDVPAEDCASFFVNPYTAVAIREYVQHKKSRSFVHTAASSQLGQMLVQLCKEQGDLTIINVVRRPEHVTLLREIDPKAVVICQKEGDWEEKLKAAIKEHKCTVAFDAVSGDMTGTLCRMMPNKSTTYLYGGLSGKPCGGFETMDLIYRKKKVEGFLLMDWINPKDMVGSLFRLRRAAKLVNAGLKPGGWACSQFKDCSMEEMRDSFMSMFGPGGSFTGQKLRVRMS